MKHAISVSLALFIGSITLPAQTSGRKDTQLAVARVARVSSNCPISLQAQRQMGEGTVAMTDGGEKEVGQRLHLTLSNATFAEIIGIQITVRGLNSKGRVSPADNSKAIVDDREISKTLHLKLKIGGKSNASTELLLPGFTSVRSIDLDSVNYTGGSTWRASTVQTCQVSPDAAMLISSR